MINFQNYRAIILHFPRYAGGKFISNCLSLSKHACPQHASAVAHLIDNPLDYQYRYNKVIETLPPQNDVHNWINKYEFGDYQLYGLAVEKWQNGIADNQTTLAANHLFTSSMHFFLTSHDHPENLLKVWPFATVITLINHQKFSKISRQLKSKIVKNANYAGNYCKEKYKLLSGESWPAWQEFEWSGFDVNQFKTTYPACIIEEMVNFYPEYSTDKLITFDIDSCIFDQHKFLMAMEKLYEKLNFDDFNQELIAKFWKLYIKIHQ